jgi:hypothetical protein
MSLPNSEACTPVAAVGRSVDLRANLRAAINNRREPVTSSNLLRRGEQPSAGIDSLTQTSRYLTFS